jgi:D-alanyl-lipoteichoic acid acyltransferase DltB (MBOAT superfamily)
MLFNSFVFLFGFLPAALVGYFACGRWGRRPAGVWLVLASFAFYGYWKPAFLPILLLSIAFNYAASVLIIRAASRPRLQSALLAGAVTADLGALAYYKYLGWLFGLLRAGTGFDVGFPDLVLPLGISFFTFTQIGYLIDVKQGVAKERGFLNFVLFVTFFPHLIAGPILHNREMMPQFADPQTYRFSGTNLTVGAMIFVIGLLKKCLLADPTSVVVAPGFAHAASLPASEAWHVALSYSLQLYFDFSGYSDMAIGLARMFNVRFPLNFNSPYKATSIVEYWSRWHMTLTRYLNLYLYNPMALWVTRQRAARGLGVTKAAQATLSGFAAMVAFPTLATMGLAGIWHGAGAQFLIFGLLHGMYLTVAHAWRVFGGKSKGPDRLAVHVGKIALTYSAVLVGSIFFRAPDAWAALDLLAGMIGLHGTGESIGAQNMLWIAALYGIVWLLPNTQQIMTDYEPALGKWQKGPMAWLRWRPDARWGVAFGLAVLVGLLSMGGTGEFLYFQF